MIPAELADFALSTSLGLHAIGNIDAVPIETGVHLRWGFSPPIGYPRFGFFLFRRPALQDQGEFCLEIPPALLQSLLLQRWLAIDDAVVRYAPVPCPAPLSTMTGAEPMVVGSQQCRRFDMEWPEPVLLRSVSLQGHHGWALVIGLRQGKPVVTKEQVDSTAPLSFGGELVDAVVVYTFGGGPRAVCYLEREMVLAGDWSDNLLPAPEEPHFGYGLPLTTDAYNLHHRFEDPADPAARDLAEARERISTTGHMLAKADFAELRESLAAMVVDDVPGRMFDREVFREDADGTINFERPLDLSLLFSLDPVVARVLGLYFVDLRAEEFKDFDYLLIGRWAAWQLPRPARVYSFATVPEAIHVPRRFALCGAAIHVPAGGRVLSYPRVSGQPARKALRVGQRHMFWHSTGPLSLRFNEPVRWIVLELGRRTKDVYVSARFLGSEVGGATVAAGEDPTEVLVNGDGSLCLELFMDGGGFDLFGFRTLPASEPPLSPEELEKPVGLATITLNVPFANAPPLPPPSNLRLRGLALPTSEQVGDTMAEFEDPLHDDPQGLGFRWDPPPSTSAANWPLDLGRRPPTDAAMYDVRFQFLGNGLAAEPIDADNWSPVLDVPLIPAAPALPGEGVDAHPLTLGDDLCQVFPTSDPPALDEFPADGDLWLQPWVEEGWYAGEVRARDLFGRPSAWHSAAPVLADQLPNPAAPIDVEAKLLQANDPELTPSEQLLVSTHGDGCMRVRWAWPPQMRRQSPHATHFRVYVKRRSFNNIRVIAGPPAPGLSPNLLTCMVESERPLPANSLTGSHLVDRATVPFVIVANTAGLVSTLTLQRHLADQDLLPVKGKSIIKVTDEFRVGIRSAGEGPSAYEIECAIESQFNLVTDTLTGGSLVDDNGDRFEILANGAGAESTLTLARAPSEPEKLPATERASIVISPAKSLFENPSQLAAWEARVAQVPITNSVNYEAIIPPIEIEPSAGQPLLHAHVGVTTADTSFRVPDQFVQPAGPPWDANLADLPGREGGVAATGIYAIYRRMLDGAPAAPRDRLYTSVPDFHGRAFYELRWPHLAPDQRGHTGWRVFRTTDLALFALYNPEPTSSAIDVSALPTPVRAQLAAAFAEGRVGLIADDMLEQLAAQPGADQAFVAASQDRLISEADEMVFVDEVDGKNPIRYLYRMRTEDDAGNRSPLNPPGQPIYVPNTYPPDVVQVTECQGGEREVRLKWLPNPEPDLAGYQLYATESGYSRDVLEELRAMRRPIDEENGALEVYDREGNLIAPNLILSRAEADALLDEGEVSLLRENLPGAQLFHYRLIAFDTAGNPSAWTSTLSARTSGLERPGPPTWDPPVMDADGLHLSWTSPVPDLNCVVQRSLDGGSSWSNLTGWLGRGVYQAVDKDPTPSTPIQYRLRVMLRNGQINQEFAVLEV
jgi:hypothetical protein